MELTVIRATTPSQLLAVREHCEQQHYLHRYPDPRSLPFGYILQVAGEQYAADGRLHGLVVMKKPQHHQQRGLFGYPGMPTSWQVLDLARVWIHPALQQHSGGHALCIFSQFVSRVLRRVQWDWLDHHPPRYPDQPYHIEVVISYCDLEHHDGTAYRASGFRWNGFSEDRTKEVYYRRLRKPLKSWLPTRPAQLPLFGNLGLPLRHD
jgi:hypothetical protein